MEGFLSGSDLLSGGVVTVVLLFVFDWGVVSDRAVDAVVVEPPDMVCGGEFEMFETPPVFRTGWVC